MMMKRRVLLVVAFVVSTGAFAGLAREIRLPEEASLFGSVVIAERFVETVGRGEEIPVEFQVWPHDGGLRPATWFTTRIEAHPGDVITLAPGMYDAQIWIFTPGVTIRTDPESEDLAWIRGTVEIDADGILIERIGVTNSSDARDSGHGLSLIHI